MDEQRCALSPVITRHTNNMPDGKNEACKPTNWVGEKKSFSGGHVDCGHFQLTTVLSHSRKHTARGWPASDGSKVQLSGNGSQLATSHLLWWINEWNLPWTATVCQEPGIPSHHGSAPHISVTESTPERNRRLLSVPANHLQVPTQQQHSSSIEVPMCSWHIKYLTSLLPWWWVWSMSAFLIQQEGSLEQQETFMNLINHGQRGRMDDQRCSLDPSRSAPCTPKNNRKIDVNNAGENCLCLFFPLRIVLLFSCAFIFQCLNEFNDLMSRFGQVLQPFGQHTEPAARWSTSVAPIAAGITEGTGNIHFRVGFKLFVLHGL